MTTAATVKPDMPASIMDQLTRSVMEFSRATGVTVEEAARAIINLALSGQNRQPAPPSPLLKPSVDSFVAEKKGTGFRLLYVESCSTGSPKTPAK